MEGSESAELEPSSSYEVVVVAKKFLIIPATSVPSERLFSAAGNVITAKRSCLSDETASMLITLNGNL